MELIFQNVNWSSATVLTGVTSNIALSSNTRENLYLHILSVDKYGNKLETVSSSVYFASEIEYLNVPITNGTYTVGSTSGWSRENWNDYLYKNSFSSHGSRVATLTSDSTFDMNDIQTVTFTCAGALNYTYSNNIDAYIKMEVYELRRNKLF